MTRLRYFESTYPEILVSSIVFGPQDVYRVHIDTMLNTLQIVNSKGVVVIEETNLKVSKAKKVAKQVLSNLGVEFSKERRIRIK